MSTIQLRTTALWYCFVKCETDNIFGSHKSQFSTFTQLKQLKIICHYIRYKAFANECSTQIKGQWSGEHTTTVSKQPKK